MGNKSYDKLFDDFVWHVYAKNREAIVTKLLDNYMLFKDENELELLIRNDLSRLLMSKGLVLPSSIFAMPDKSTEFDPAMSNYRTVVVFRLNNISFVMDINLNVNRPIKHVTIDVLTTMSIDGLDKAIGYKEDYNTFGMYFHEVSTTRRNLK